MRIACNLDYLKAIWGGIIRRVNDPSVIDKAVQGLFSLAKLICTVLDRSLLHTKKLDKGLQLTRRTGNGVGRCKWVQGSE